ncbi:hypothetical protein DOT_1886 [Desulfosporosinus sp. OT]|nr:hypothetical protein DOT_1886 [Desulfosporosinus sp. OT]
MKELPPPTPELAFLIKISILYALLKTKSALNSSRYSLFNKSLTISR